MGAKGQFSTEFVLVSMKMVECISWTGDQLPETWAKY